MKKLLLLSSILLTASIILHAQKITSFFPVTGTIGTAVTINGTGFSTTPTDNIVYFGAVKATVILSSATSLTVLVPAGAGSVVPVSVTVGGLITNSITSLTPTFTFTNTPNLALNYSVNNIAGITSPYSMVMSDFNNDGKADLAVTNVNSASFSVLLGNGTGNFGTVLNYPTGPYPQYITTGDFNGDGNADLALSVMGDGTISVFLGLGNGFFGPAINFSTGVYSPTSIEKGDFNGDGKIDMAVTHGNSVGILLGTGIGSFGAETVFTISTGITDVAVGDFNDDGKADLALLNAAGNWVHILIGDGTGIFTRTLTYTVGQNPVSIVVADLNGDGKDDIATANTNNLNFSVSVLLGNGTGSFSLTKHYAATGSYSLDFGDFNGDGKIDLMTVDGNLNSVCLLPGDGTGAFPSTINFPVEARHNSAVVGDFNNDGKADLAVTNPSKSTVSILLNTVPVVTTQQVTNISTTKATGNGNINVLVVPNPTQYGVVWSTATNPTIALATKTEQGTTSSAGPYTSNITGLSPGTKYYAKAYATNVNGTVYGDEVSFTTLVPPIITTQGVTNINTTTATGNGNITFLGSNSPTQYGVVWSTATNPTIALTTKTEQGAASSTGAFTSSMTGLSSGTTYYVKAYATNADGTVYGNEVSFTTLVPPAVTTQEVTDINSTTATGNGNITVLGSTDILQYGVIWSTATNPTIDLATKSEQGAATSTGAFTSSITALTPGTIYYVKAYATNANGTVYGNEVSFTSSITNGLNDNASAELSIYPNPVIDKLYIKGISGKAQITVIDMTGKNILSTETNNNYILVNNLSRGIYFMLILDENGMKTANFTKK